MEAACLTGNQVDAGHRAQGEAHPQEGEEGAHPCHQDLRQRAHAARPADLR